MLKKQIVTNDEEIAAGFKEHFSTIGYKVSKRMEAVTLIH